MKNRIAIATKNLRNEHHIKIVFDKSAKSWFPVLLFIILILVGITILNGSYKNSYILYATTFSIGMTFVFLSNHIRGSKSIERKLYIVGFFMLGSLYIFRDQIGIDDWQYLRIFNLAKQYTLKEYFLKSGLEIGFQSVNYLLFVLGCDYNLTQIIISGITIYIWGIAIWNYRKIADRTIVTFLFVTLLYYLMMASGLVRIFLASGIIFWGLRYVFESNYKKFFVVIIVASLFHMSALVTFILVVGSAFHDYFYRHWKLFLGILIIVIPISFFIISRFLAPSLGARYAGYMSIGSFNIVSALIDMISVFPFLLYGAFLYPTIDANVNIKRPIMILIGLTVIIQLYNSVFHLGRIAYYTLTGVILLCGILVKSKKHYIASFIFPSLVVIYGFLYLFSVDFAANGLGEYLLNYHSILNIINSWFGL